MSDSVLDLIDNVIDQHGDAMRWSPDAPEPVPGWAVGLPPAEERLRRIRAVEIEALAAQRALRRAAIQSGEQLPYELLDADEREAIHDWIRLHGLAPEDIPLDGLLGRDPLTGEWRIRVYRRPVAGKLILNEAGEVDSYVVRRIPKAPLVWRCAP